MESCAATTTLAMEREHAVVLQPNCSIATIDYDQDEHGVVLIASNLGIEAYRGHATVSVATLDLSDNMLDELYNVTLPSTLRHLDVANNRIARFELVKLPKSLQSLTLNGNPLRSFEIRESDVAVFTQLNLPASIQINEGGCTDSHAAIRHIGRHTVCVVSDERFALKKFGYDLALSDSVVTMKVSTGSANAKMASSSSSHAKMTAVIAGSLSGLVVVLAIWLWWRRRQHQQKHQLDRSHRGSITAHSEYVDAMTPDTIAMMTHSFGRKSFSSVPRVPNTTSIELYKRMTTMKAPSDSVATPPDSPDSNADSLLHSTLLDAFRVEADSISDCTLLYEGQFTQVYKASMSFTEEKNRTVAVRKLSTRLDFENDSVKDFMGDIALATMLRHPNIVELIGFYSYIPMNGTSSSSPATVSEFMANGDLETLLNRSSKEDPDAWKWLEPSWIPKSKAEIAMDVASALEYLHSRSPSLHPASLRARDVLLTEEYTAKLCALGINRSASRQGDSNGQWNAWLAPEVLRGEEPSDSADVYSFGVLLTALDTLSEPFSDALDCSDYGMSQQSHLAMLLCSGSIRPVLSLRCPAAVQQLAQRCLSFHASDRPSAAEVVASLRELQPSVPIDHVDGSCQS